MDDRAMDQTAAQERRGFKLGIVIPLANKPENIQQLLARVLVYLEYDPTHGFSGARILATRASFADMFETISLVLPEPFQILCYIRRDRREASV